MAAEAPAMLHPCKKPAPLPPPPALFLARARSRVGADQGPFSGPPDTPPRRSPVTVPFLWEDAPGKPKPTPAAGGPVPDADEGGDRPDSAHADRARPLPLKLPPRLQHATSFAASDTSLSPKTVLQGPYYGCVGGGSGRRRPRCGVAAFRRTPSAGVGLFSRTWSRPWAAEGNKNRGGGGNDHERDASGPDAPWCSPASSSSSSSVSTCFGGDDHGHGHAGRGRLAPADGREACSEEDDGSPRASVKITRFRRNRSLPSMATSNLWASIRRSVKQITPWS